MQKMWWFGAVRGQSGSAAMSPFDRVHMTSHSPLIETMHLSCTVITARCYASAVLAMAMCRSVCLSVRPSVTSRCSTKTAKCRITQTTLHDTPGTLVFCCQRSPRNSTGVTTYGVPNAGGVGQNRRLSTNNWLYLENGTR